MEGSLYGSRQTVRRDREGERYGSAMRLPLRRIRSCHVQENDGDSGECAQRSEHPKSLNQPEHASIIRRARAAQQSVCISQIPNAS